MLRLPFPLLLFAFSLLVLAAPASAQDTRHYQVFQFPANMIPRVDGDASDWKMVPASYTIGMDQLTDDNHKGAAPDPKNMDVQVKVGWVKGLNRLYFLYEAYDDYWDFTHPDLHNDIFEVVVDGDRSGGPLISTQHPIKDLDPWTAYFSYHGVQAQNYHIFTPAEGKDWALAWGAQPWIKDLPYANAATHYNFRPGQAGKLTLEFWITPFDYAGNTPDRAVESKLTENKVIGLSWAVLDYDDVNDIKKQSFWNLSREHTMYGNANYLLPFTLMPLEARFKKPIDAQWSFTILDPKRRLVAFQDQSEGSISTWRWDFGDGTASTEQHPLHQYKDAGKYVVVLWVEGPAGKSRRAKVWDVAVP